MNYPQLIHTTDLPTRNAPLAALAMTFTSDQVPYFPRKYDAEDLKIAGNHLRAKATTPNEKLTADELVAWGWYWRSYRRYPLEHPTPEEYFRGIDDDLVGPEFRSEYPYLDCGVDPHSGRWEPARASNRLRAQPDGAASIGIEGPSGGAHEDAPDPYRADRDAGPEAARAHREQMLRDQHPGLHTGLVFPSNKGTLRWASSIRSPMIKTADSLGIDVRVGPQVIRRTVNTLMEAAGVNSTVTRQQLGHVTEDMTHHYASHDVSTKEEGLKRALGELLEW